MSYQQRLKTFFLKNDPERMYLVNKIVKAFRDDEETVMKRLEEIYNSGGPTKLVVKDLPKSSKPKVSAISADGDLESNMDVDSNIKDEPIDQPVKKKGKLIKIIILVVVLAILGGGGYFGYNMFFGGNSGSHTEETHEDNSHGDSHDSSEETHADSHTSESSETHSVSDSAHADEIDSTHSGGVDSTHNESADSTLNDIEDAVEALRVL